jgi:16S rRNA (cytosine967-C5)-methyltransferase
MIPFKKYHLLQLLNDYEQTAKPLDLQINHYFRANKALGSKDRAYIAQTAFDIVKWKGLLDALAPSPDWDQRLKVYEANKNSLDDPVSRYKDTFPLHVCVSFPHELFECLVNSYGAKKAAAICLASNRQAPTFVRANTLKISRNELLDIWSDLSVRPAARSKNGIIFDKRMNFFTLNEFKKGYFEVQDEGSQLLADLVQAKPGDHFMDYCAGSGGKTLAVAPQMENRGQIYLHDIRKNALIEAKKRLRRAGVENGQVIFNQSTKLSKLKRKMDWVLVDAPCSGTGTLRRNPDMKWKFANDALGSYVSKQRIIFERGLSFVKPGGHIVYATCSLLKEENQNQLDFFLKNHSLELSAEPFQSIPEDGGMDGFYGVVFKKPVK